MSTVREKLQQISDIYAEANAKAAPLVAELEPYLEAAQKAKKLGLSADSTAQEITDAYVRDVSLTPAVKAAIPSVINSGSVAIVERATATVFEMPRQIGGILGQIAGLIFSLK